MIIFDTKEADTVRREIAALRVLAKSMEKKKRPDMRGASIVRQSADRMEELLKLLERNVRENTGKATGDHLPLRLI